MLNLANTALSNLKTSTSLTNPMTVAQIALAVKEVPFEDIVFVQYPTRDDSDDANKVVPDRSAADELFAAIEANAPLEITHENNSNEGVIVEGTIESPTTADPAPSATPDPAETAAPEPTETAVALPDSIKGNTAAQQTCSNGNVRE
jgi:hypothetical protein